MVHFSPYPPCLAFPEYSRLITLTCNAIVFHTCVFSSLTRWKAGCVILDKLFSFAEPLSLSAK